MVKNQFEEKEMSESKPRARYTLQFKLEALKLVKGGQVAAVLTLTTGHSSAASWLPERRVAPLRLKVNMHWCAA